MAAELTPTRVRASRTASRRRSMRDARGSLLASVLLLASSAAMAAPAGAATVQEPDSPITLRGEGTDSAEFAARAVDALGATSEAKPLVDFIGSNESEGLRAFLAERTEFYIGALPLDEVEPGASDLLAKGRGVISAPFQATAAVPFMSGPYSRGFKWCATGVVFDEETFELTCSDPNGAVPLNSVRTNAPGDSLRLYPESLVILFTQSTPTDFWFEPNFASQADPSGCPTDETGACLVRMDLPGTPGPASGVRTDGAAVNKFLQEYLKFLDPTEFTNRVLGEVPDPMNHTITVRWPRSAQASRSPDETLTNTVASWGSFQTSEIPKGGSVALVHPLRARLAIALESKDAEKDPPQPVTDLWITDYVHHGEVVSATPEAITKAIAAGGETPFYAAYNTVPDAWPMSWVNRVHFPARGLSVDQTNTAAVMLRLQMTVGQEKAADLGDGRLTPELVQQGLAAANEVVESNCAAAQGRVVNEVGAGPYTPDGLAPALEALGSVSWCQATDETPPPPPTTNPPPPGNEESGAPLVSSPSAASTVGGSTAPFAATGSSAAPFSSPDPTVSPASGLPADPGSTASEPTTAASPPAVVAADDEETTDVESIAAEMPLPLPGTDPRTMDRLATLALGGAIFFALRALWRSGALHGMAGVAT